MDENLTNDYSLHYLLARFRRIELLIETEVGRVRGQHIGDEQFRGLYISEADVDKLLGRTTGEPPWGTEFGQPPDQLSARLSQQEELAESALRESLEHRITPRLQLLANLFCLSPLETDCLLICLATELDLKYERLFGYLLDDVTKRHPNVDLVLRLLRHEPEAKIAARRWFSHDAPLFRNDLLELFEEAGASRPPLLGRSLRVNDRISSYLVGSDLVDVRLMSLTETLVPEENRDRTPSCKLLAGKIAGFLNDVVGTAPAFIYLHGGYGSGAEEVVDAVCAIRGLKVLTIVSDRLFSAPESLEHLCCLLHRESSIQNAALLFSNFDTVMAEDRQASLAKFIGSLSLQKQVVFCSGESPLPPAVLRRRESFVSIDLSHPGAKERADLWSVALNGDLSGQSPTALQEIATKFRFTPGQISDAAQTARNLAGWNQMKRGGISMHDVYEACRMHSNQRLGSLARKIRTTNGWSDIVLPPDRLEQLREICIHVRYREQVYAEWGFNRKLSYGTALTALFAGPSGTGKTMAAGILAAELGLDLYKIDLSTVVSKYIGETEKNLARIFTEAETSNAILFFDEADALFGKRSEVRDSHDRYANIETGYLLQRMEEYDGVAILATNFRRNMDEAFVRRLQFTIEFPLPTEADRLRIWQTIWPDGAPLSKDLDLNFMAHRFEISGGHIRNIALAGAFMAASEQGQVGMSHLMRATRRELQKMGKIIAEGEFAANIGSLAGQI